MSYRKIVQVGATGNFGKPIFQGLIDSGRFEVTVLGRKTSSFVPPTPDVNFFGVDYSNHAELVEALRGQDAIIMTQGGFGAAEILTKSVVNAAIEAGVKHVIPSLFGADICNPPGSEEELFRTGRRILAFLKEKQNQISYNFIAVGNFFEGLENAGFGIDIRNKKVRIYEDGKSPFNTTTYDTIARAIINVFSAPDKFINRDLRIHDFYINQWDLKAAVEAETGETYDVEYADIEKMRDESLANMAQGKVSMKEMIGLIIYVVYAKRTCAWGIEDDSELVQLPKKDLREEVRKVLKSIQ